MKKYLMFSLSAVAMTALLAFPAAAATPESVDDLVEKLTGDDAEARVMARSHAGPLGAEALAPVVELMDHDELDVRNNAQWTLRNIVHYSTRPHPGGDNGSREAVADAVVELLSEEHSSAVQREALYLISLCGGADHVEAVAAWLDDEDMADQACYALVRIPDSAAAEALTDALDNASGEHGARLAHALAQREEAMAGEKLEALTDSDDETVAEAAEKALAVRSLRF